MIEIAVNNLAAATGARTVTGEADQVCRGCVIDSRQVEEGTIFVAFPGENVDGNDFASRAVQSGAGAVVMTREPEAELVSLAQDKGCAILLTDDPEEFLLRLAHTYRLELGCLVVGITGSIGKTTTKDVLAAVLAKRYRVWATKGNFNNLIGMPLTVLSAPADTEVLVLEMGMNHFHEIERLSQSANPNLAIVSKIGTSHIGILGSRENIARAKAEVVQGMCGAGDVMLAGVSDDDEVRARDVRVDDEGRPVFTLDFGQGETIDTMLAIPGVQSVPNAVKAAAVAYRLGVTPEQIDAAFRGLTITGHRQEIKRAKSGARVIDDSYNASAESMAAGLDLLCSLSCTGSRMAILGEMGEMGDEAPRMHELVGAYAAAKKLDMLACVGGELAQLMADAARMMGMDEDRIQVFSDYQQVLDRMGGALEKHDVVLVKGSRFVELDRFVEGVC